ncbi:DUF7948 domain-containing protein [Hymenobacter qilianensis]|uniref:DUF7948 domain-containing protein n=1 Tax=Hymenobacter qilianensis TaxID=1385715 RepID=UPI001664BA0D|nr:gliding motility-associated C-terminal domain-containing protein [Hymenobacter qilianensis]
MLYSTLRLLLSTVALTASVWVSVQAKPAASAPTTKSLEFVENKGQWDARAQYMAELPAGRLFLEKTGFTYTFADPEALRSHREHSSPAGAGSEKLRAHAYRVTFDGSSSGTSLTPDEPTAGFRNYFLGNDAKHWASSVRGFRQVRYTNVYPRIGARVYENAGGNLEYDFTVQPGGKPSAIRLRYTGTERLSLENGQLVVQTSVGTVTEQTPKAWQEINGQRVPVACAFILEKNVLSFRVGAYDSRQPLIIDPTVIFSSFTGSTADNWGFTATYDAQGNMYSGGIVFGLGYPASLGAVSQSFGGGVDVAIIKYNTTVRGSAARLYATYLGGNLIDAPHSLVVNSQNELVILGSTGSNNFPVSRTTFDDSFNGGPRVVPQGGGPGMNYEAGADLFVSKLNSSGSTLVASTYLGGTGTDGIILGATTLTQNYGDEFRGDIITDTEGNIYIASTTNSTGFPVRNGFRSTSQGGASDAVVLKFAADLRTLVWSSYLGGSGADAAYSIQIDDDRNVYVSGGTTSSNLAGTTGRYQPQLRGGIDGFVARISSDGAALTHATYVGTPEIDQTYFLQLDAVANVYVLGQTRGAFPRTAGLYGVANGRQFVQKFDNTLTTSPYSTTFGTGRAVPDLSLTAFLVDDCERIYVSGWGGATNSNGGNTQGLPTTPDASQRTTDGSDFYIVQFKPGMTAIEYATFFGENGGRGEHVDGGTSRFDKRGAIYQAVCGGCGGTSGFPVPPGANFYSTTNNATNCNNAAFKIDFAAVVVNPGPNRTVCYNAGAQRLGGSPAGGVWSGPGVTAIAGGGYQFTPSASLVGRNTLTYTVNTTGVCQSTKLLRMTVTPEAAITFAPPATVCSNTTAVPLTATPAGGTFSGRGVTGSTFNPSAAGIGSHVITYTLADTLGCGTFSRTIVVDAQPAVSAGRDTTLCSDETRAFRMLRASPVGGVWSGPGMTADGMFTPPNTNNLGGIFTLEYTVTVGVCKIVSTRKVTIAPTSSTNVSLNTPECQAAPEYTGLAPFTMQFAPVLAGGSFSWDFGDGTTSNEEAPSHVYENPGTYPVQLTARYAGCTVVTQFAAVKVGKVQMPNIFTPNNDNLNDTFAPRISCKNAHLTVFTRWGSKVYEADNYQNDWSGDKLPEGVYYYLLRDTDGKSAKGWVEIKR